MAEYDTAGLLSEIRERGSLPASDLRFSDTKLLAAATQELRDSVAPLMHAARAEHLVYDYSATVTSGTARYRMPPRAIGGSLRDVYFVGSDGNPMELRQVSSAEIYEIGGSGNVGTPEAYYVRNYHVILVPTPNVSGTLKMPHYARPNKLVLPSECATIASVSDFGANWAFDVSGSPPGPLQDVVPCDFVRGGPGFETLISVTPTYDGSTTYEVLKSFFDGDVPAAGDYICLEGQSPVPQVPPELHGLLAARVAARCLKAVGDANWQSLRDDVAQLEERARNWLAPRVDSDTVQAGGSIGRNGLVAGLFGSLLP